MCARTGTGAVIEVVREVADREGVQPTDLPPLYESIDPDAIDSMISSVPPGAGGSIEFTYVGYEISVCADGEITVGTEKRDVPFEFGRKEGASD